MAGVWSASLVWSDDGKGHSLSSLLLTSKSRVAVGHFQIVAALCDFDAPAIDVLAVFNAIGIGDFAVDDPERGERPHSSVEIRNFRAPAHVCAWLFVPETGHRFNRRPTFRGFVDDKAGFPCEGGCTCDGGTAVEGEYVAADIAASQA